MAGDDGLKLKHTIRRISYQSNEFSINKNCTTEVAQKNKKVAFGCIFRRLMRLIGGMSVIKLMLRLMFLKNKILKIEMLNDLNY